MYPDQKAEWVLEQGNWKANDGDRACVDLWGASIMVDPHIQLLRVDTLNVPIEHILQVIQIIVLSAGRIVVGEGGGETGIPPVIFPHGRRQIPVIAIQNRLEILRSDTDVRLRVVTVASVRRAFVAGDLHHPDLARTASDAGVAAGFLECDGSEEDGGDLGFLGHVLEHGEVLGALREGVSVLLEYRCEVLVDQVVERNGGWGPAVTVDAAVEPVLVTVWTSSLGRLHGSIRIAALVTIRYDDSTVSSRCWLWGGIGGAGRIHGCSIRSGWHTTGGSPSFRRIRDVRTNGSIRRHRSSITMMVVVVSADFPAQTTS